MLINKTATLLCKSTKAIYSCLLSVGCRLDWLVIQCGAGYQPDPAWVISCAGCAEQAISLH